MLYLLIVNITFKLWSPLWGFIPESLCGWAGLIGAEPVGYNWVEPDWFLLLELCCLCRVFVPALQASTVINSPGSLCMLTHTDKKWWRERWREGERESRGDRRTHTHTHTHSGICGHGRSGSNGVDGEMWYMNKHFHLGWWMTKDEAVAKEEELFCLLRWEVLMKSPSWGDTQCPHRDL